MNIAVCVKHIPDPNVPPEMDGDTLKREGVQGVLDPGDEFGVEAGLQLKETAGSGEVTLVSMGPSQAMEAVRRGLSMGADKGILISDDSLQGADALVTARVLAAAIKRQNPDVVIAGVESTDGSTGTMPMALAELLELPSLTFARQLELKDGSVVVHRQTETGYQVVDAPLPALITVTAGINDPRYPTLKGIMQAKQKPMENLTVADLGLSGDEVKPTQDVIGIEPAPEKTGGEVIEDGAEAPGRVVQLLIEAKVI